MENYFCCIDEFFYYGLVYCFRSGLWKVGDEFLRFIWWGSGLKIVMLWIEWVGGIGIMIFMVVFCWLDDLFYGVIVLGGGYFGFCFWYVVVGLGYLGGDLD